MKITTRILSAIGLEKRSTIGVNGWPVPLSASSVTPTSAQSVAACYAAVALISEAVGSLPLRLYRKDGDDRTDLTALVIVGQVDDVWHVQSHFWTPEQGLEDRARRDRAPYDVWHRQGYLRTTPGATVDYAHVAHDIAEILSGFDVQAVAFDRWRIDLLKKEFDLIGCDLPLVPFGQGFKDMAPALDALEAELLNGRIAHGGHPVLTMCAANATVTKDPTGARKLDKSRSTGRIDGMQALAMAMGAAARAEVDMGVSMEGFTFV